MKHVIGGVEYIGAELIEPYFSLWSRWWPWSTPPRPYTHVMRRYWLRTIIVLAILLVTLAVAIIHDKGTLRWWQRLVLLLIYTAVVAIAAHDFWCGAELGEGAYHGNPLPPSGD